LTLTDRSSLFNSFSVFASRLIRKSGFFSVFYDGAGESDRAYHFYEREASEGSLCRSEAQKGDGIPGEPHPGKGGDGLPVGLTGKIVFPGILGKKINLSGGDPLGEEPRAHAGKHLEEGSGNPEPRTTDKGDHEGIPSRFSGSRDPKGPKVGGKARNQNPDCPIPNDLLAIFSLDFQAHGGQATGEDGGDTGEVVGEEAETFFSPNPPRRDPIPSRPRHQAKSHLAGHSRKKRQGKGASEPPEDLSGIFRIEGNPEVSGEDISGSSGKKKKGQVVRQGQAKEPSQGSVASVDDEKIGFLKVSERRGGAKHPPFGEELEKGPLDERESPAGSWRARLGIPQKNRPSDDHFPEGASFR
jgi:hypothetical protein